MKSGSNYKCVLKAIQKFKWNYWKHRNKRKNTNMSHSQDNTKIEFTSKFETWWIITSDGIPKNLFHTWYKTPTITHRETYSYMHTYYMHTCTCGYTNTCTQTLAPTHTYMNMDKDMHIYKEKIHRHMDTTIQTEKHIYEERDRQTYTCAKTYTHSSLDTER